MKCDIVVSNYRPVTASCHTLCLTVYWREIVCACRVTRPVLCSAGTDSVNIYAGRDGETCQKCHTPLSSGVSDT